MTLKALHVIIRTPSGTANPGGFNIMITNKMIMPAVSPWFTEYLIQLLIILMEVLR